MLSVRTGSSYSFSESDKLQIPTTILSRIISSCRSAYPQCSANSYKAVMNESTDSPSFCFCRLNFAHSYITFLVLMKCESNLDLTVSSFLLSASDSRNERIDQRIDLCLLCLLHKSRGYTKSLETPHPPGPFFRVVEVELLWWRHLVSGNYGGGHDTCFARLPVLGLS